MPPCDKATLHVLDGEGTHSTDKTSQHRGAQGQSVSRHFQRLSQDLPSYGAPLLASLFLHTPTRSARSLSVVYVYVYVYVYVHVNVLSVYCVRNVLGVVTT